MISERIKYQAITESVSISTANSNRDGTGTIATVVTGGGPQNLGTIIKRIIIKATGNTTSGMIRFYLNNGGTSYIFTEQKVQAVTKSASDNSYSSILDLNLILSDNVSIMVSTQNAETFIITAEGLDFYY